MLARQVISRYGVPFAADRARLDIRDGQVVLGDGDGHVLRLSPEGSLLAAGTGARVVRAGPPLPVRPAGGGGFDVAADGRVYLVEEIDGLLVNPDVQVFDPELAAVVQDFTLALPDDRYPVMDLRLLGDEIIVRRADPATLFEVYDRQGGFRRRIAADVEVLTASWDSDVWYAGEPMGLAITHDPGRWPHRPEFRAWLRPLDIAEFTELRWFAQDMVDVPAGCAGPCQLRIAPDTDARRAEYVVNGLVEVVAPGR